MYNNSTLGGSLTPTNRAIEFGIRVSPVEGGFLINKFDQGLAVCTTVEAAKKVVIAYFEEILEAKPEPEVEEPIIDQEKGLGTPDLPFIPEPDAVKPEVTVTDLPEGEVKPE